ncbi:alpha-galactosidase [Herbiconiux sp. KACC 21604]|uniref:alpha-galactosidase n=1 Tax=unclassified Herbiconiux TaxID=2618217 RepID=UPI0014920A91|nr:alpha-galactosidase [Herbiconiux sp. SALV-R1]QJU54759.1 alpha-galactosidase [Herbiconiux sp. SALV-R1]WPO85867.1 alpha-galactosidase [Herbiconiux sp. KACC 21604]
MTRIIFIGAGSVVFTRQLLADLLQFDDLGPLEVVLHDISRDRLDVALGTAHQLAERFGRVAAFSATTDRRRALEGADFVVNVVLVGGAAPGRIDLEVPAELGLLQTVADTTGIGGVFRALRTFPLLSAIARDMAELCPTALFLNYTNPMAMNVGWLAAVAPWLKSYGLCHSIYWTVHDLCELVGVPLEGTRFRAAGVNHQSWLTEWTHDGEDLYPRLRDRIAADPELERRVRVEIFRRIGSYPTENSEHSAEYTSWFLRTPEQIERYRLVPLWHIASDEQNLSAYEDARAALAEGRQLALEDEATEYAPQLIHSLVTGSEREIHVNVVNDGLIDNLPADAVVEVPAMVNGSGVTPIRMGRIPTAGAALNRSAVSLAELTLEAALTGDREKVRQAVLADPLATAVLTPAQIWSLCDRLTELHAAYLPVELGGQAELVDVPSPR